MYEHLFQEIKIRSMTLRNRVIFPAMATHLPAPDGTATDRLINYHVARVKGGCGLNIVEAANVHASTAAPLFASIYDDRYIPGWRKFNDAVHAAGGKSGIQLWQGGLVAASMGVTEYIVPCDITVSAEKTLKGASAEIIREASEAFGAAAGRAVKAGFDCVEFHVAHNYSPHMFLSPAFNQRTDEYGGSFENRARYPLDCIRAIRANVPQDYPVLMRIDAQDDYLPGGLTIDDIVKFCLMAGRAGVDALDISRGNVVSQAIKYEVPAIDLPRGFNVDNAAYIRKKTNMITIAVGRINDPEQAEKILAEGKADMVVMGRAQIADPEFCNKAKFGKTEDIIRCVGCNQGCYDRYCDVKNFPHLGCLRNFFVGKEDMLIENAEISKKVVIIGGGMGGMEAASILKKRGHKPILLEKSDKLGGVFGLAGLAPRKDEMTQAALSRGEQIIREGVDVRLNTTATPDVLDAIAPDTVINASGALPVHLDVPGVDGSNVCNSFDVLRGIVKLDGKSVAVIGGGLVGLETAEYLAEKNCKVTVVEMMDVVAKDVGPGRAVNIRENMALAGIESCVNATCTAITADGVNVKTPEGEKIISAEAVVIAIGSRSRDSKWLEEYCTARNIDYKAVGDVVKARRAIDAIHEAVEAALVI